MLYGVRLKPLFLVPPLGFLSRYYIYIPNSSKMMGDLDTVATSTRSGLGGFGLLGFEPRTRDPESLVLPLHHNPMSFPIRRHTFWAYKPCGPICLSSHRFQAFLSKLHPNASTTQIEKHTGYDPEDPAQTFFKG